MAVLYGIYTIAFFFKSYELKSIEFSRGHNWVGHSFLSGPVLIILKKTWSSAAILSWKQNALWTILVHGANCTYKDSIT